MKSNSLGIIGCGPTAIYLLKHIADKGQVLVKEFKSITIFEKRNRMGMGMPYTEETTDKYNLSNISSEEIPQLTESFADWLRKQDEDLLVKWNIEKFNIKNKDVYSRIALGYYFHEQYNKIITKLKSQGFVIDELTNHEVLDIIVDKEKKIYNVITDKKLHALSRVILSVGHNWNELDNKKTGYYASPWPITKLIPKSNTYYNFEIGILGASLSAFDVVTSLAHRHGKFKKNENDLKFCLNEKAKGFKIVLHSSQGWLPHLQYEQEEPIREIYRHSNREDILSLIGKDGFMPLEAFYNKICRPALINAFYKDNDFKTAETIKKKGFSFKNFIDLMSSKHEYINSFVGMKNEMVLAKDSVLNYKPIHWMETLDDLMYCLNFHNELLCAEDHLYFKKGVMPFLMNVIAALPLSSAAILLALYDSKCIDLVTGRVTILESGKNASNTIIEIEDEEKNKAIETYKIFINCGGQKNVEIENYPFPSLQQKGIVSKAKAKFKSVPEKQNELYNDRLLHKDNKYFLYTGGIDVDPTYRVMCDDDQFVNEIYDISFTHITGARPYSYGLQACNSTALIVVESWLKLKNNKKLKKINIESITKLYDDNEVL